MYPSGLVDRINPYDPRFRTTGTSSADWVTRPQLTKPISISRYQFIKEYHIRKFQPPIGRQQTNHYIAIAQQAFQLTKTKAFVGAHPQQEHGHSTEKEAAMKTTSQTEQHDVDNGNLSASNPDQDNFGNISPDASNEFVEMSTSSDTLISTSTTATSSSWRRATPDLHPQINTPRRANRHQPRPSLVRIFTSTISKQCGKGSNG
jgi:hypothetical protein